MKSKICSIQSWFQRRKLVLCLLQRIEVSKRSIKNSYIFFKNQFKDDEEIRPTGVNATKMGPDDIQLHVHSDHDTGGHWCAKVLFFSLLAVLLGLIGIILLENRGISDRKWTG